MVKYQIIQGTLGEHIMGKLDKLSKFLSLILRHKPEAANIELDEHGWANVEDLIIGINQTGQKTIVEQKTPEYLYHGTADRFLGSIMAEGLKPMSRLYVHLSKDIETAWKVGKRHGTPAILRINSGKMYQDGYKFYLSANGVWLAKQISPIYFTLLENMEK